MKFLTFNRRPSAGRAGEGSSSVEAAGGQWSIAKGGSLGGCRRRPFRHSHRGRQLELNIAIVLSQNFFLWFAIILVNGARYGTFGHNIL